MVIGRTNSFKKEREELGERVIPAAVLVVRGLPHHMDKSLLPQTGLEQFSGFGKKSVYISYHIDGVFLYVFIPIPPVPGKKCLVPRPLLEHPVPFDNIQLSVRIQVSKLSITVQSIFEGKGGKLVVSREDYPVFFRTIFCFERRAYTQRHRLAFHDFYRLVVLQNFPGAEGYSVHRDKLILPLEKNREKVVEGLRII